MLTNANRRINCFSNRNYSFLKLLYNIFRVVIEDNKCSVTPANGISDSASFMTVGTETQTLASADISQMETRRGRGEGPRIHRDVTGKKKNMEDVGEENLSQSQEPPRTFHNRTTSYV